MYPNKVATTTSESEIWQVMWISSLAVKKLKSYLL